MSVIVILLGLAEADDRYVTAGMSRAKMQELREDRGCINEGR
jgi:hypothetical protein